MGNIFRILYNPFYYGSFEYPKDSGNWYQGKHDPIITKELFDLAQNQLKNNVLRENKEFAFTKLMTCGLCSSGISATEKFKNQKNGNVHKYIYYGCTKAKDKNCKCRYIEEKELIKQFERLMDKVNLNEMDIQKKLKEEMERFRKFQRMISGSSNEVNFKEVNIKEYVKYILREGNDIEKREILKCFKGRIILLAKVVTIQKC